jgi:hypothetical protein
MKTGLLMTYSPSVNFPQVNDNDTSLKITGKQLEGTRSGVPSIITSSSHPTVIPYPAVPCHHQIHSSISSIYMIL